MIKIQCGITKRKAKKQAAKAFSKGYCEGFESGESSVIHNLRNRIELLNPDFPVPVSELRKWVGLNG